MSLNFIDISSWQAGLDLAAVFAGNPLHGVVVKATQGTSYVNQYCDKWVQYCIKSGKPWGFYHYLSGNEPAEEAKYFIKHCFNYFGDGVPVADYEGDIVANYGTVYLRKWLETVYTETKVKPMVYCNLSTIQSDTDGFRSIAQDGYPLWLAQWASAKEQYGFIDHPWQSGSYAPFSKITMHQYTDRGKLNGYSGNLDLDIFYGTVKDWNRMAGKTAPVPDMGRDAIVDAIIELLAKLR